MPTDAEEKPDTSPPLETEGPFVLADVLVDELEFVGDLSGEEAAKLRAPDADLDTIFSAFHDKNLSALCLSGGGIRSATFGLGIIQALAEHKLLSKIDYLSTVSGGGYLGSWLSEWIRVEKLRAIEEEECKNLNTDIIRYRKTKYNEPLDDDTIEILDPTQVQPVDDAVGERMFQPDPSPERWVETVEKHLNEHSFATRYNSNPEASPICHLRQYSNFMTPSVGLMSADTWAFFSIYLRNVFLNWTIFVPLMVAVLLIPRILYAATQTYRENLTGGIVPYILIAVGIVAGSFAVCFIVNKLPSKVYRDGKHFNTDGWVLLFGALPLVIFAICSTTYWLGVVTVNQPTIPNIKKFVGMTVTVYLIGYYAFIVWRFFRWTQTTDKAISFLRQVGVVSGLFMLLGVQLLLIYYALVNPPDNLPTEIYAGFAAPVLAWILVMVRYVIKQLSGINYKYELSPPHRSVLCGLAASVAGGVVLWLASQAIIGSGVLFKPEIFGGTNGLFETFAVPIFLLVFLFHTTLYVGLSSKDSTDDDREWFARFVGWLFLIVAGWIALNGFVLIWPFLIKSVFSGTSFINHYISINFFTGVLPVITVLSGVISLVGGFSSKLPIKKDVQHTGLKKFLSFIPQIAAAIFLGILVTGLAYGSAFALTAAARLITEHSKQWPVWMRGTPNLDSSMSALDVLGDTSLIFLAVSAVLCAVFGTVMAWRINVNTFSLHGAYRDRLIRAYLGASHLNRNPNTFTGFDSADNRQLHRIKHQKPFHVLCATLNLIGGDNLAWQNRKAASFTMSPLYTGSWLLNYRRTNQCSRPSTLDPCKHYRYCNRHNEPCSREVTNVGVTGCQLYGKSLRLGTAMAISGAAANPNMGYYSSPIVTFLMALFNIRLGWWIGNPAKTSHSYFKETGPAIAVLPLINETLGRTSENNRFLNITDGGHFENLAIYEMVRRRCQFIIVSDAAADEQFTFGEISNAIEKCRVDLGVTIDFREKKLNIPGKSATAREKNTGQRFAVADIIYPASGDNARRRGCLIYLRPTLLGKEPINIKNYSDSNPSFPHQSTGDQFFDEKQFEAYRELGYITLKDILKDNAFANMQAVRDHVYKTFSPKTSSEK